MASLKEIRDKANTQLTQFWSVLQTRQDAYFAKHGKYFQLLITPENKVVDGTDNTFTLRKPNDEKNKNDVTLDFTSKIPFNIEVHDWVNKTGAGYEAIVTIELLDGRIYQRSRTNTGEDTGWNELDLTDELF